MIYNVDFRRKHKVNTTGLLFKVRFSVESSQRAFGRMQDLVYVAKAIHTALYELCSSKWCVAENGILCSLSGDRSERGLPLKEFEIDVADEPNLLGLLNMYWARQNRGALWELRVRNKADQIVERIRMDPEMKLYFAGIAKPEGKLVQFPMSA